MNNLQAGGQNFSWEHSWVTVSLLVAGTGIFVALQASGFLIAGISFLVFELSAMGAYFLTKNGICTKNTVIILSNIPATIILFLLLFFCFSSISYS